MITIMRHHSQLCSMTVALLLLCCFTPVFVVEAREDTLSYFQYATLIELPPINTPQLAELRLDDQIYSSVRTDFADFRIVQNSNQGLVPVKIAHSLLHPGGDAALVNRDFAVLEDAAYDLKVSYAESRIITVQTGRMPITQFGLRSDTTGAFQYMLLGQSSANPTGAEWQLLTRNKVSSNSNTNAHGELVTLSFPESSYSIYAIVVDGLSTSDSFKVESASGPEYCAYFQAQPGQSYTLLTGYPEATSISGLNSDMLAALLEKGVAPVRASATPLTDNPAWRERGLWARTRNKMFLLPVAIAAALMAILLLFVIVYSFVYRKKPLKLQSRPRFQR